jgi:hypothetical protein
LESASFLSWVLLFLIGLAFLVSGLTILVKGAQWMSKNKSPLSWNFDVFLDHHGGAGANATRVVVTVFHDIFRPGKVFYDADSFFHGRARGNLGVIMDAAKLSKACVVAHSNETWCRSFCTGAICSAVQKEIPITTITFGCDAEDESQAMITVMSSAKGGQSSIVIDMLAKQAPRNELRPLGLSDDLIPVSIEKVINAKQIIFALDHKKSIDLFVDTLLKEMPWMPLMTGRTRSAPCLTPLTRKFFSRDSIEEKTKKEEKGKNEKIQKTGGGPHVRRQCIFILFSF